VIPITLKPPKSGPGLKLFWLANLISSIALGVYLVAFNWLTVKNYGAFGVSMVTIGYALPQTALVLFGGLTSDVINKQTMYRICQILYILSGLALFLTCMDELPTLWFLTFISFISGVIVAFSGPNKTAMISALVPESQVTTTQEFFYFATGLGWVLGSILASHLISTNDLPINNPHGALAFLFYIVGMAPSIFLAPKVFEKPIKVELGETLKLRINKILLDLKNEFAYLLSSTSIRTLIWTLAIVLILGTPFSTMLSIYAHDHPSSYQSSKFFAHIYAVFGAGSVSGALIGILIAKSTIKQGALPVYLIFGVCIFGTAALLIRQQLLILLMIFLVGLFLSLCTNLLKGLTQSQSADAMRGRTAGVTQLLAGFSSVSAGLAGFIIHRLSNHETNTYLAYEYVQLSLLGLLAILTLLTLPAIIRSRISL
jgi:MFS family permease